MARRPTNGAFQEWPGIPGGYVRDGVYCIRRSISGRRYERSLETRTAEEALTRLTAFLRDPKNWTAAPPPEKVGLHLDTSKVEDFLKWSKETKHNSEEW